MAEYIYAHCIYVQKRIERWTKKKKRESNQSNKETHKLNYTLKAKLAKVQYQTHEGELNITKNTV